MVDIRKLDKTIVIDMRYVSQEITLQKKQIYPIAIPLFRKETAQKVLWRTGSFPKKSDCFPLNNMVKKSLALYSGQGLIFKYAFFWQNQQNGICQACALIQYIETGLRRPGRQNS